VRSGVRSRGDGWRGGCFRSGPAASATSRAGRRGDDGPAPSHSQPRLGAGIGPSGSAASGVVLAAMADACGPVLRLHRRDVAAGRGHLHDHGHGLYPSPFHLAVPAPRRCRDAALSAGGQRRFTRGECAGVLRRAQGGAMDMAAWRRDLRLPRHLLDVRADGRPVRHGVLP
jgi:hypothetical protein